CWGGGGGGGSTTSASAVWNSGGAGGGGEYRLVYVSAATIGSSQPVTIGAGGVGATAGANAGGSGGQTLLGTSGSICGANGGGGGGGTTSGVTVGLGGAGGTGGSTGFGINGQKGGDGYSISNAAGNQAGVAIGGDSHGLTSEKYRAATASASCFGGINATLYATGGGPSYCQGSATNQPGGNAGGGLLLITEFNHP